MPQIILDENGGREGNVRTRKGCSFVPHFFQMLQIMQNVFPSLPAMLKHCKSHIPRKDLPPAELTCLSSPFPSDNFYYIQLNKHSRARAKPRYNEELQPPSEGPELLLLSALLAVQRGPCFGFSSSQQGYELTS